MKRACTILYMTFICHSLININAQNDPVANYLQQTEAYAGIYNGKMETPYNMVLYENLPYYMNADFTEATVVYKNSYYPNQKVRLDLYKEQLIVVPPGTQHAIALCSADVERVNMHKYLKTFVWLDPSKESGLKTGFYMLLSEGEKMQLLCKERYSLQQKLRQTGAISYFEHGIRYYLLHNNRYYTVKNKGSFSKLFPQYKKQINKFAKNHRLDFKHQTEGSLVLLSNYCEELLNSTNKQ